MTDRPSRPGSPADLPVSPALADAPVLAHVVRGGLGEQVVESVHHGTVVVTAPDGSVQWALGDPTGPVFPRSASKPLQAVAMVRAGLDLPPELLALASASHSGEPFHIEGVRRILGGAGLTEADLQNTPDYSLDESEHEREIREGEGRRSVTQNCSGKHSAMLATCVAAGWDPATYRDPQHPLQQHIEAVIGELAGTPVTSVVVDGCGAPQHGYPLVGLARAFGHIAAAQAGTAEHRVAAAINANPTYLGGTTREVSTLIADVPGLVAKDGAEAVYAVGLPDGRGIAVKVADGGGRARGVVLAAVLRGLGIAAPRGLAALEDVPVLGHGVPVGAVVAAQLVLDAADPAAPDPTTR